MINFLNSKKGDLWDSLVNVNKYGHLGKMVIFILLQVK